MTKGAHEDEQIHDQQIRTDREFDVVVWGASGFTGQLVAEHLHTVYGDGEGLRWALAGRNQNKLETIRQQLNSSVPILIGDSEDEDSLRAIATRTRVVCSTVGPYLKYGEKLVAVCAATGTDYCDLTGEVLFIHRMIDRYAAEAKRSGARLCNSCGFDSLPSDLGTLFIQQAFNARHGHYADEVKCRVRSMKGAMSGGTVDSMINMIDAVKADPALRKIIGNPHALNPATNQRRTKHRDQSNAVFDTDLGAWTAPFIMAGINTRIVRRSNALLGDRWGDDFQYSEAVSTGVGLRGRLRATIMSVGLKAFVVAASISVTRRLMFALFLPRPGDGPDAEARRNGYYVFKLLAKDRQGNLLRGTVRGDRDPGYGSTSRMLGETAVYMARDLEPTVEGGFWTPASILNGGLTERLGKHAGVEFRIDDDALAE